MKYGKVLTYKDIEEAKKLIGKNVIASNTMFGIVETPNKLYIQTFDKVATFEKQYCYETKESYQRYQFIREVIEDKPKYRPFKNIAELAGHWCDDNNNLWAHREKTMPLIWVRTKETGCDVLITGFDRNTGKVSIFNESISLEKLFKDFIFLDGSPCGVKE